MSAADEYVLNSRYFGPISFDRRTLFQFSEGLPGFEAERAFAPIEIPEQRPLLYLQSVAQPDLCLITLPVRTIVAEYELSLASEYLAPLGFGSEETPRIGEDLLCLAIMTVDENQNMAANLMAPIVVNIRTRRAVQAIQTDSPWSYRHPLAAGEEIRSC